jgi:hypothetical protein
MADLVGAAGDEVVAAVAFTVLLLVLFALPFRNTIFFSGIEAIIILSLGFGGGLMLLLILFLKNFDVAW